MKEENDFIEDISIQGIIRAVVIRSPVARGVIKEIKPPKLPSSYCLISAADIPGQNKLEDFSVPILAEKEVSYIGQPVAILMGQNISKLENLALATEVIVEEQAAPTSNQTVISRDIVSGNPDGAFSTTAKIVSGSYATGIQEHWYAEPHGAIAVPPSSLKPQLKTKEKDTSDTFVIYTASQWPYHVKNSVARVLNCDSEKIAVSTTVLGPHLDGKLWYPSLVACQAALAAHISGKPVILMLTKVEDFMFSPKRNSSKIQIRSALGEKGEILGSEVHLDLDLGAEDIFADEIIDHTCLGTLGLYKHQSFKINGAALRSNIPPQGPMAGFGLSQGFFAAERHVSQIADSLGQDPAEWRKNNFLVKNQTLGIGTTLKEVVPIAELIDAAASMSDYYRKWASYELLRVSRRGQKINFHEEGRRGIGVSTAYQGSGFLYNNETGNGNCTVELTLDKEGSLEIKTSIASCGTDYQDNWRDMAQDILGVDPALIRLKCGTQDAPDSGAGTLSRNIGVVTRMVFLCCQAIRKQRFHNPLPITVKRSAKSAKAQGWNQEKNIDLEAFSRPSWGAVVVEIEIDSVSLEPIVRGIWLVVDGGKILSQRRARRTLRTGIIQALGWTCRENIYYVDGKIPEMFYQSYNIPAPSEIPPIHVDFIWNDTVDPKGIGDLPFCCIPAAYIQAVSQAMDHPFEKIPLDARDIWNAVKLNKAETPA